MISGQVYDVDKCAAETAKFSETHTLTHIDPRNAVSMANRIVELLEERKKKAKDQADQLKRIWTKENEAKAALDVALRNVKALQEASNESPASYFVVMTVSSALGASITWQGKVPHSDPEKCFNAAVGASMKAWEKEHGRGILDEGFVVDFYSREPVGSGVASDKT